MYFLVSFLCDSKTEYLRCGQNEDESLIDIFYYFVID